VGLHGVAGLAGQREASGLGARQVVWSTTHRFAGTLDFLAEITVPGQAVPVPVVGDIKTGKAVYGEALLQVSAYVAALREMEHAPPGVWGAVVRLPKTESDPPSPRANPIAAARVLNDGAPMDELAVPPTAAPSPMERMVSCGALVKNWYFTPSPRVVEPALVRPAVRSKGHPLALHEHLKIRGDALLVRAGDACLADCRPPFWVRPLDGQDGGQLQFVGGERIVHGERRGEEALPDLPARLEATTVTAAN
jgi:hypothetical protein